MGFSEHIDISWTEFYWAELGFFLRHNIVIVQQPQQLQFSGLGKTYSTFAQQILIIDYWMNQDANFSYWSVSNHESFAEKHKTLIVYWKRLGLNRNPSSLQAKRTSTWRTCWPERGRQLSPRSRCAILTFSVFKLWTFSLSLCVIHFIVKEADEFVVVLLSTVLFIHLIFYTFYLFFYYTKNKFWWRCTE